MPVLHLDSRENPPLAPYRNAVLFGSEGCGLAAWYLELCDRRITVPMRPGVDSLNVAVAAGIVLHHVMRPSEDERC